MAKDMTGEFIGPLPVETFFERFMAKPEGVCPAVDFSSVPLEKKERHMYAPFVDAVNPILLGQGLCFVVTSEVTDSEGENLKPNVVLCREEQGGVPQEARTVWHTMELHVEMKDSHTDDPFKDGDSEASDESTLVENATVDGISSRGQISLYAAAQLSRQHRLWMFSVGIFGRFARLFRWDRAGVIVSAQIDYHKNSQELAEFFWRFSHMTRVQRGYDSTVEDPTLEQGARFIEAIEAEHARMEKIGRILPKLKESIHADSPRWNVTVDDRTSGIHHFVVGKPIFYNRAITGRCTRGYVALDLARNKLVFLKDSWRIDNPKIESERKTYKKLKKSEVPFIADFFCGDDVPDPEFATPPLEPQHKRLEDKTSDSDPEEPPVRPGAQITRTQDFPGSARATRSYIHFRMVQNSLCLPIDQFTDGKHLVQILCDVLRALGAAWEKARILHRDVSGNNVMIKIELGVLDGPGVLNDWDLCRSRDIDMARQNDRTGTWQFISTLQLQGMKQTHDIADDLESVFHVLLYYALHYVKHNIQSDSDVDLEDLFEQETVRRDTDGKLKTYGGRGKHSMFTSKEWVKGLEFKSPAFTKLFWNLHRLFAGNVFYHHMPAEVRSPPIIEFHEKLRTPSEVIRLFEEALALPDSEWVDDRVQDQFPSPTNGRKMDTTAVTISAVDRSGRSSQRNLKRGMQSDEGYSEGRPPIPYCSGRLTTSLSISN